jgi:response regulator RpfG family c-di-GMP phosphodiesterase
MRDQFDRQPVVKSVLLVDDEERLRSILARYLRARGHRVFEAASAAGACDVLGSEDVDILLLDINLAADTGWDVLRWVPPSAKRLEQFQPDAVLNKPFPIDTLARLVESVCEPTVAEGGWGNLPAS